jgi:hypothetical protein
MKTDVTGCNPAPAALPRGKQNATDHPSKNERFSDSFPAELSTADSTDRPKFELELQPRNRAMTENSIIAEVMLTLYDGFEGHLH